MFGPLKADTIKKHRKPSRLTKRWLTTLLYLIPLDKTMNYILPFYWDSPKKILDVTAGERIMWRDFPYNHKNLYDDSESWHVDFCDSSPDAKADFICNAQEVDKLGKYYDVGVCDFPFIDIDKGMESFGTKSRGRKEGTSREFYFRKFRPPVELFKECLPAFNKTFDSLIIKMGDSHENHLMINNHVDAILTFDKRRNPESDFNHIDTIHYRGNYSKRGANVPFAQPVVSYYMIFKKEVKKR